MNRRRTKRIGQSIVDTDEPDRRLRNGLGLIELVVRPELRPRGGVKANVTAIAIFIFE